MQRNLFHKYTITSICVCECVYVRVHVCVHVCMLLYVVAYIDCGFMDDMCHGSLHTLWCSYKRVTSIVGNLRLVIKDILQG